MRNGPAKIKKIFLPSDSESDCLRKNFNNAPQISLFDLIQKLNRWLSEKIEKINKVRKRKVIAGKV